MIYQKVLIGHQIFVFFSSNLIRWIQIEAKASLRLNFNPKTLFMILECFSQGQSGAYNFFKMTNSVLFRTQKSPYSKKSSISLSKVANHFKTSNPRSFEFNTSIILPILALKAKKVTLNQVYIQNRKEFKRHRGKLGLYGKKPQFIQLLTVSGVTISNLSL